MLCPHCHTTVPDGATVCPHCSAYLGAPAGHTAREFIFCEGCGARLTPKDRTCPKCGRPAPGILSAETSASDLAAGKTASFPKLLGDNVDSRSSRPSAAEVLDVSLDPEKTSVLQIPASETKGRRRKRADEDPYHRRKHPYGKIAAALITVGLIVSCVYLVTEDPLGVMPGFYAEIQRQAAEMFPSREGMGDDADTSGTDDTDAADSSVELTDDTVLSGTDAYERLLELYTEIGDYQDPLSDVIDDYNGGFLRSSLEARQEASESAYTLRDEVQGTIDELDAIQLEEDSVYEEDLEHLKQLATWMYNRVDVLCQSWDISLSYPDGESMSSHQSEISQPLRDALDASGNNENLVLFEEYYSSWCPTEK